MNKARGKHLFFYYYSLVNIVSMSLIDHSVFIMLYLLNRLSEMPIPFVEFTGNSSLLSVYQKYWKYGLSCVLIPNRVSKSAAYIGTILNEEG